MTRLRNTRRYRLARTSVKRMSQLRTANEYWLRPLGLINGLFGGDSATAAFIAMIVDADGAIERFERLDQ